MSVGVSLGRFTLRATPRRSRWSATVRRWTPNSRARSSNERPCWYAAVAASISEGVSRRWTGFAGPRAAPSAVGESTLSTSAWSALEPGFECCPLLSGPPAPGRFADRWGAFCGFRPTAGVVRNPWSGAVSSVSEGFESRPQRSTGVVEATTLPLVRGGSETDAEGSISGLTTLTEPSPRDSLPLRHERRPAHWSTVAQRPTPEAGVPVLAASAARHASAGVLVPTSFQRRSRDDREVASLSAVGRATKDRPVGRGVVCNHICYIDSRVDPVPTAAEAHQLHIRFGGPSRSCVGRDPRGLPRDLGHRHRSSAVSHPQAPESEHQPRLRR